MSPIFLGVCIKKEEHVTHLKGLGVFFQPSLFVKACQCMRFDDRFYDSYKNF